MCVTDNAFSLSFYVIIVIVDGVESNASWFATIFLDLPISNKYFIVKIMR